ncbi:MAG: methyl-accepting chemotaxis protein [Verrucomicrobia bacterium]|nr:methyl-accepting chemotaxis protein [Verrucomicrobiota bacterium]
MKNWTIAKQLSAALIALNVLLVAALTLFWWMETEIAQARSNAMSRREQLLIAAERVRYDMLEMSDALRGLLLDPKNEAERRRKLAADEDLLRAASEMRPLLAEQPDLLKALEAVTAFDELQLNLHENKVIELTAADLAGANRYYTGTYLPLRQQQEQLVAKFNVLTKQAIEQELQQTKATRRLGLSAIGLIPLASWLVGRRLAKAINTSLVRVSKVSEQLRAGNFELRFPVEPRDEFGQLGEGLNRMLDELARLVRQVQRSGIQLNTSVTEITATTKEQEATAGVHLASTSEIGATAREISTTTQELVRAMQQCDQVVTEAEQLAGRSQSGLTQMEATMQQVMEAAGGIASKLAVLNAKAANINNVVVTIHKVADQTNLLSLNAAIEAEKAGEAGLGFAVVASEVRRLADQTAEATYDIEEMVKEIQAAVSAGVLGMDKFTDEVRKAVEEVGVISAQLAQLIQRVQLFTPQFETMRSKMDSQTAAARQISDALSQINGAAQQTSDWLQQSSTLIARLNDAARGLQDGVGRIRVAA